MRADVLEAMADELLARAAHPLASFQSWDDGRRKLDGVSAGRRWDIDREQREFQRESRAQLRRLYLRRWVKAGPERPGINWQRPHPLRKLSTRQVGEVLDGLLAGERVSYLARRLAVAPLVVRLIRESRTYREVPRPPGAFTIRRTTGKLTPEQVTTIVERLACGERATHLAPEYGVSRSTIAVIRCARYYGRKQDPRLVGDARRTDRNSRAKLSDDQVRAARAWFAAGLKAAEVARRLSIGFNTAKALRDGVSYRRVLPVAPVR